ncbi:MAG: limonene-1,2-epoxide hydrolase family protein, partial [Alphaproteobacteria bacterium]
KKFIAACETGDAENLIPFFAEDAIYHNIPMEPVTGKDAIRATLSMFMGNAEEVIFDTPFIAETANGDVLTERLDKFRYGENWLKIRVMGTFEFDAEGKITHWRDYFDMGEFQSQMAAIAG